jgi:plastocyanin
MRALRLLALILLPAALTAATLEVQVRDRSGASVTDAVIWARAEGAGPQAARRAAVMDQKNRTFIPHVLTIQMGTSVEFPNSDNVLHHVYSFSPAKQFQLPLYKGNQASPVVFDKPGVVELGCNIHDRMSAFIVVVDTPHFGRTDGEGRVTLRDLPPGTYAVSLWYQSMREKTPPTQRVRVLDREILSFVTR